MQSEQYDANASAPSPVQGNTVTSVELLPWQVAEIRRQLYTDLRELEEHIAEEADRAAEMNVADNAQQALGADLRDFVHRTFAATTGQC